MGLTEPVLLSGVLDRPSIVTDLLHANGPYWNQAQYQPADQRLASAVTPAGHPFSLGAGAPPLFRGNWADETTAVPGVPPLREAPVLMEAACRLFDGYRASPSFLYVNLSAPSPTVDTGHVDVPAFRGLDRRSAPGWFLLALHRSGLFERWWVRTATAVVWFYEGQGGALTYWPQGPNRPSRQAPARSNTALVGDGDRMYHRVEAVGDPDRWSSVPRQALLHHDGGDRWSVRLGDEVLDTYRLDELRVSVSWKAEVWSDEDERIRRVRHLDDLDLARAVAMVADALGDGGRWSAAQLDDPAFVEAVMAAWPRPTPAAEPL